MHLYLSAGRGSPRAAQSDRRVARRTRALRPAQSREVRAQRGVRTRSDQMALFLHHLWATDGSLGVVQTEATGTWRGSTTRRQVVGSSMMSSFCSHGSGFSAQVATTRKGDHRELSAQHRRFGRACDGSSTRSESTALAGSSVPGATAAGREHRRRTPYGDALPDDVTRSCCDGDRRVRAVACRGRARAGFGGVPRWPGTRASLAISNGWPTCSTTAFLADARDERRSLGPCRRHRPLGEEPVFDATVAETHNFVANGIALENSSSRMRTS